MAYFLLIKGDEREQVATHGNMTPTEEGSNPRRWKEIRVPKFCDDLRCERFDEKLQKWVTDVPAKNVILRAEAEKWLASLPPFTLEVLAERLGKKNG